MWPAPLVGNDLPERHLIICFPTNVLALHWRCGCNNVTQAASPSGHYWTCSCSVLNFTTVDLNVHLYLQGNYIYPLFSYCGTFRMKMRNLQKDETFVCLFFFNVVDRDCEAAWQGFTSASPSTSKNLWLTLDNRNILARNLGRVLL